MGIKGLKGFFKNYFSFSTGGELVKLLQERYGQPYPPNQVLKMFYQICRAVAYMHKQTPPVIHRDLKVSMAFGKQGWYCSEKTHLPLLGPVLISSMVLLVGWVCFWFWSLQGEFSSGLFPFPPSLMANTPNSRLNLKNSGKRANPWRCLCLILIYLLFTVFDI